MLKELVAIFRGTRSLQGATQAFTEMLQLAQGMVLQASETFWGKPRTAADRTALYETDVKVNKLERNIRKRLIAHLSGPAPSDVPYSLLVMSLVKDVERIGDYAKNLMEVADIAGGPFPEDPIVSELREIKKSVENLAKEAVTVFSNGDRDRAVELTVEGRAVSKRCEALIREVARSSYTPPLVVSITLGTRFYKRIAGHFLNLLSGVIMPVHKLDYFDEESLAPTER